MQSHEESNHVQSCAAAHRYASAQTPVASARETGRGRADGWRVAEHAPEHARAPERRGAGPRGKY